MFDIIETLFVLVAYPRLCSSLAPQFRSIMDYICTEKYVVYGSMNRMILQIRTCLCFIVIKK